MCGPGPVLNLDRAPKDGQEGEDAALPVAVFVRATRPLATAMGGSDSRWIVLCGSFNLFKHAANNSSISKNEVNLEKKNVENLQPVQCGIAGFQRENDCGKNAAGEIKLLVTQLGWKEESV